jgi:hypothetical protein
MLRHGTTHWHRVTISELALSQNIRLPASGKKHPTETAAFLYKKKYNTQPVLL